MINIKEIGRQIGEQIANEPGPSFYPGGFKAPHKGHFSAAIQAASKPFATQVKVIIGHGERTGEGVNITPQQSKAIWDIYLKAQPNPKISVEVSPDKSPIKPLFSYFANIDNKGYVVGGQKEIESGYFKSLEDKFPNRVFPIVVNDTFNDGDNERVSGTEFRDSLSALKTRYQELQQTQKGSKEYTVALNEYNNVYNYLKTLVPEAVVNKGMFDDVLKVLGMNYPTPDSLQETKDIIPGGLAKGKTLKDIAKKHDKKGYYHIDNMVSYLKKQLAKGIKVELEHTTSKKAALEIAMDHLWEDPKYYIKLSKIEEVKPNPKNQPDQVWLEEYKNKNQFNPAIFDGDEIDPKVKELLLRIATYFWESLEIEEPFEDVTLTGSSANYNYTKSSDIDLHILVDFNKFSDPEIIKKFFDAKKNIFNDKYDLKLGKQPIEIYIQDTNEQHTSSGVYSIMNNEWIKKPEYESINIPDGNIKRKSKPFKEKINDLVKNGSKNPTNTLTQIKKLKERIRNFRQSGLDKSGEYSLENLAFKDLRNTGYLDKLSQLSQDLTSNQLKLNEGMMDSNLFERFMSYACKELDIQNPPSFEIKTDFGGEQPSFGAYVPFDHHIFLNPSNRNIVDVLRTLAHELVHAKQNELQLLTPDSGETGHDHENDANSIAGILMRDYGKQNPDIYNIGMLNEAKEERPKITRIYFDLDGVLAGFDDQFKKYNKEGLDFKDYIKEYGANKAWDIINKGKSEYWSEMDWNPGGKQLFDYVNKMADKKGIEVWVLSSPGLDPNGDAKKGKNEWVSKHTNIPENRRVYKQAKEKHTEAKPGYLLIDDMGKNVTEFIEAGGFGIKNNPENSMDSIKKLHKFES
jgi:predicted nucleotidyltransferase